jgi:hypothetical protein
MVGVARRTRAAKSLAAAAGDPCAPVPSPGLPSVSTVDFVLTNASNADRFVAVLQ